MLCLRVRESRPRATRVACRRLHVQPDSPRAHMRPRGPLRARTPKNVRVRCPRARRRMRKHIRGRGHHQILHRRACSPRPARRRCRGRRLRRTCYVASLRTSPALDAGHSPPRHLLLQKLCGLPSLGARLHGPGTPYLLPRAHTLLGLRTNLPKASSSPLQPECQRPHRPELRLVMQRTLGLSTRAQTRRLHRPRPA